MDYKNITIMPPIAINIYAVVLTICYFYAGGIFFDECINYLHLKGQ
jgi:hypothetical protein